ncbi:MAG: type IV secretion system DNA-binding domain-containing protein [Niveispirillum sp.]|uniref:type IV secretion system DNA-binding domain-containing protein n=1 Tax=Niveispirillum sp. TaxID=1917217 RepID=UPI00403671CA
MSHPMLERKPTAAAVTVGSILTLISVVALGAILLQFIPPLGWYADHPFPASLSWLWAYSGDTLRQEWWRSAGMSLPQRVDWLVHATWTNAILPFDIVHAYRLRLTAVVIISAMVGMTGSLLFSLLSPYRDGLTHLTGRRLWRGYEAISKIRRTLRSAINCYGSGLAIAPSVVIDRAREVQHIGLCGTTGSGKTTILRALAQQVLSRNDKVVLHDTKGDVVAGLPAERFILMAPHDARSHAWDVAQDITSSQDARELAARLIHDSREPMWSGAAREILTGIVISLQRRQSRRWSWRDLANAAFMPTSDLLCLLQDHHPAAARYIEIDSQSGAPTRTTHGILITMWADVVGVIQPLASAWGDAPPERRFSLSRWLVDDKARLPKALVLQRSPRYPKLSEALRSLDQRCDGMFGQSHCQPRTD